MARDTMPVDLLGKRLDGPARLRELLAGGDIVVAPGAYDALSARLVELHRFAAVYLTGFGAAASRLGRPDIGFLGRSEMVDQVAAFVGAVSIPVIADADTGYGNSVTVAHTVAGFEQAGAAAIHLEDQVAPKRCGHLDGKEVIPVAEMVAKIEAAVAARRNPDFVLIARSDARAVEGFDATVARLRAYLEAGADVAFFEAPESEEEVEALADALRPAPLLFNWVEKAKSPPLGVERLQELGFAIVIHPISTLLAATRATQAVLESIRETGTSEAAAGWQVGFEEFGSLIGLEEIAELEQRFSAD